MDLPDPQGVLLLDKPVGITSHFATQLVRKLYHCSKAGHTGTLDPMARGLLPICLGQATKFSSYLLETDKIYEAVLRFGATTTTGDKEGSIVKRYRITFDKSDLKAALQSQLGQIHQVPPMYSALKHKGKPLYEYARKGITIEREPRNVSIYAIDLLDYESGRATINVHCSKGTYIRTLAEDIGRALQSGAYLEDLKRLKVGQYDLRNAIELERLRAMSEENQKAQLMAIDSLLTHIPFVILDQKTATLFCQGQRVCFFRQSDAILRKFRVYQEALAAESFLGVGQIEDQGMLSPKRLMKN